MATKNTKGTKAEKVNVKEVMGQSMGMSKDNYQAMKARAKNIKDRLTKEYEKTGTIPSHKYIIREWGYNASTKSVLALKKSWAKQQGLDLAKVDTSETKKLKSGRPVAETEA